MKKTIEKFKKGTSYLNINKAVSKEELAVNHYQQQSLTGKKIVKFIPASGAATRMFQNLYLYLEDEIETDFMSKFFTNLEDFAFYSDLALNELESKKEIVKTVIDAYGLKPKALIKIHEYQKESVTPIEEHIYESLQYINKEQLNLHFTISENHEDWFNEYVKKVNKDSIKIDYSFQEKSTDTLAVDLDNNPFVLEDNKTLYRPGGHGALIYNLDKIDADIIYIKNIDNVCSRNLIEDTVKSKQDLTNIGLSIQTQIFDYINALNNDNYVLNEIEEFLSNKLNITLKEPLTKELAYSFLNRPLRVCGVVKNEGEPGGGPFIVDNVTYLDPQIVEMKEIDTSKDGNIVDNASFFNPVDLVCFVKDANNSKYNLLNYINEDRYFISEKSYLGRSLKALEHPGLWNGAMHNWNTVLVEVPLLSFNPIKTVNDLLRKGHQG